MKEVKEPNRLLWCVYCPFRVLSKTKIEFMRLLQHLFTFLLFFTLSVAAFSTDRGYFIGDGGAGQRVLFYTPIIENADSAEYWISKQVKRQIIDDFINFSDIDVIDSEEKLTILKLQRESESAYFSDENPLEIGKAIQAKNYVKLVVLKNSGKLNLTATIINLETGKIESSFSSDFLEEDKFTSEIHGIVADNLLESLGVKLTPAGKRILMNRNSKLTPAESKENIETFKTEFKRLEKEYNNLIKNEQHEFDYENRKIKLEKQMSRILEQKKLEEERYNKLSEEYISEKKEKESWAYQEKGNGRLGGFGINFGAIEGNFFSWFYIDKALNPYMFLDFEFGAGRNPFGESSSMTWGVQTGIGFNKRFHIFYNTFHPALFYIFDFCYIPENKFLSHTLGLTVLDLAYLALDTRFELLQNFDSMQKFEKAFFIGVRVIFPDKEL